MTITKRITAGLLSLAFAFGLLCCSLSSTDSALPFYNEETVVHLPESLRTIEESAFEGTAIEMVWMENEVEEIRSRSFAGAENLIMVYFPESVIQIAGDAFDADNDLMIYGSMNSVAEDWAKQHGVPFRSFDFRKEALIPDSIVKLLQLLLIILFSLCVRRMIKERTRLRISETAPVVKYRSEKEIKQAEIVICDLCFP